MKKWISLFYLGAIAALQFSCNGTQTEAKETAVENHGVHIDYSETGRGDTTLVFVHGWCLNKTYWSGQVAFFKGKYRVVAVTLPGFGQSGKNRTVWNTETYGSDIDSVLSQLNLKNVILVGHSMAGDIVLQAAINEPDRVIGLVGVDNFRGVGHVTTAQDSAEEANFYGQMKHHFKALAFDYFNQYLFYKTTPDSIRKRILNDVANADTAIAVASLEQGDFDEVKGLLTFKKTLYLINSDYMPTDTTGLIAHHIPYRIFNIRNTGHFPMVEQPDAFNASLAQVIAKH
jgi:pimeloyl-ACP methyl ester carboxylesterase